MCYEEDLCRDVYRWTSDDAAGLTDKAIYFDMDGTIADLYGIDNWLDKLIAHDPSPYYEALPLVDPEILWTFCSKAAADGYRIGIVSWLSKQCPVSYAKEIIGAKMAWADEILPVFDEIVLAPFGIPKSTIVQVQQNAVLIDDEEGNRNEWTNWDLNRIAFDTNNMMGTLATIEDFFGGQYYYNQETLVEDWSEYDIGNTESCYLGYFGAENAYPIFEYN